jgi:hypothetical protein
MSSNVEKTSESWLGFTGYARECQRNESSQTAIRYCFGGQSRSVNGRVAKFGGSLPGGFSTGGLL